MSKSKKKEKNVFTPTAPPKEDVDKELLRRYADEEGVETTNILSKTDVEVGGPVDGPETVGSEEYIFKGITPGKAFLHPPKRLTEGRVVYRAKFYGHMNVKDLTGHKVVKDVIDKLKTVAEVYRANNPGRPDIVKDVEFSVSIRGVTCVELGEKKEVLHQHPIHAIAFSAEDKRGRVGNMVAYIAKGRPPLRENICYVLEVKPKQAKEVIATIGQAFELSYRKYVDAKKAREEFEQLKHVYKTATEEEKVKIREQLEEEARRRAKEAAAAQQKQRKIKIDPEYRPSYSDAAPAVVPEDSSGMTVTSDDPELMEAVRKQASEMELEAKLKVSKKDKPEAKPEQGNGDSSIVAKWENITTAMEPFQVEPSLDPTTQYLVPRLETSELDGAITELNSQIQEVEEAFAWRTKAGVGPLDENIDMTPFDHPLLATIDERLKEIEATTDDMEVPDLPVNYVMDEFVKAKEKANLPKKGTVKDAASGWYKAHHD